MGLHDLKPGQLWSTHTMPESLDGITFAYLAWPALITLEIVSDARKWKIITGGLP
jgi:hypothetical protein